MHCLAESARHSYGARRSSASYQRETSQPVELPRMSAITIANGDSQLRLGHIEFTVEDRKMRFIFISIITIGLAGYTPCAMAQTACRSLVPDSCQPQAGSRIHVAANSSCVQSCAVLYQQCRSTGSRDCNNQYSQCVAGC
jgi:hypothetical protein